MTVDICETEKWLVAELRRQVRAGRGWGPEAYSLRWRLYLAAFRADRDLHPEDRAFLVVWTYPSSEAAWVGFRRVHGRDFERWMGEQQRVHRLSQPGEVDRVTTSATDYPTQDQP